MRETCILSFSSFQSGVGKTTLAILLTLVFSLSRKRVLVVDLDPQCNTSLWHAKDSASKQGRTLTQALTYLDAQSFIRPSHIDLCDVLPGAADSLEHHNMPTDTFERLLGPVTPNYDVVILDCPAMLNNMVISAWAASTRVITPARPDSFDQSGIPFMLEALDTHTNLDRSHHAVVINFTKPPRRTDQHTLELDFGEQFEQSIPNLYPRRIPQRAWIGTVINRGRFLSRTGQNAGEIDTLVDLASWAIGYQLVVEDRKL